MTILANLQNIHLSFGSKLLFDGATLTIHKSDRIGLIGLNGKGKSTLFKILTGEVVPDSSRPPFIYDKGQDFSIFLVPQEIPLQQLQGLNIHTFFLYFYPDLKKLFQELDQITHALVQNPSDEKLLHQHTHLMEQIDHLGGHQIQQGYESYLKLFDLFESQKKLSDLSGGEMKKLSLSAGLSAKEELILWDEPTNHLDIESIEKLEDELSKSGKTYIIISHDRYLLGHVTNKICHIHDGVIEQYEGSYLSYLEFLEEREKERLKQLDRLSNRHRRELAWMRQGIKARGTRSKKRVESFHDLGKAISELKGSAKRVVNLNLLHSGRKTKKLVEIEQGQFSYADTPLLKDLNLAVYKKDKIALIGPNGAGKSTLINLLSGNLKMQNGRYHAAEGLKVGIFDQKRMSLDPNKTPKQLVADGSDTVILPNGEQRHVHSYLEAYLFSDDQINRPVSTLSGGEKNRLQLAMFMKEAADLWIFDEPTNDLDIETIELLESQLKEYEQAVIIIGHDRAFLDNIAEVTWLINQQQVEIFTGGYSQVAPYLHALEMESAYAKASADQGQMEQKKETTTSGGKVRMSNKEKMRWKSIEGDIEAAELQKEEVQTLLHNFDFTQMNEQKRTQYAQLEQQMLKLSSELEALYQEWEDLAQKEP